MKHKTKRTIKNLLLLLLSLIISAFCFVLLQLPTNINTGGSSGLAQIMANWTPIDISILTFISTFSFLILALIFLERKNMIGVISGTFLFPLFVKLVQIVSPYLYVDTSDLLVVAIFAGILIGTSTGLAYKSGYGSYGVSVLAQIAYKYKKISITKFTFVASAIIILVGAIYSGFEVVIYAILTVFISRVVTDYVLLGISRNKTVYLISEKENEVKDYIENGLKLEVVNIKIKETTIFKQKNMLLTTIDSNHYFVLREGLKELDPNIVIVTTDVYQYEFPKET